MSTYRTSKKRTLACNAAQAQTTAGKPGSKRLKSSSKSDSAINNLAKSTTSYESQLNSAVAAEHRCEQCDRVFNKSCYLTQHNKTIHSGEHPFKCQLCGKRFPCDISHEEHYAKHLGDKPHKCTLCPKEFNYKTDLRRHMHLHSDTKPFNCDSCGKGFVRKDHMVKHSVKHRLTI